MKTSNINVILIFVCVVILLAIAWLIFTNRGSDQIVGITIKSFIIPVIAGAGLLFIEFMKPIEIIEKEIHIGLSDDPNILLRLNNHTKTDLTLGIQNYAILLAKLEKDTIGNRVNYSELKELMQVLIVDIMTNRYQTHWDSNKKTESWFFEGGSSVIAEKKEAEKKPLKLTISDLTKTYSQNELLNRYEQQRFFYLPSGSKMKFSNSMTDLIVIETDNIVMNISLSGSQGVNLPHTIGKTSEKIFRKLGVTRDENQPINFFGATLEVVINQKRIRRWSPNTLKEVEWAKGFAEHLQETIGWEELINEI